MTVGELMSAIEDKKQAWSGDKHCNWRAEELVKSLNRRLGHAREAAE